MTKTRSETKCIQTPRKAQPLTLSQTSSPAPPPALVPTDPHQLELVNDGRPIAEQKADSALSPITTNAQIAMNALRPSMGQGDLATVGMNAFDKVMRRHVDAVVAGEMGGIEAVLASNVFSLNAIFAQLVTKAQVNISANPQAAETYMRLAFRAQSQCRASAETLGELKNPRPLFINAKQANVAGGSQQVNNSEGPQQINNGSGPTVTSQPESTDPVARAGKNINANKLLVGSR